MYIQTAMLGTREYTLCSPLRANAYNSSYKCMYWNEHNIKQILNFVEFNTHLYLPSEKTYCTS